MLFTALITTYNSEEFLMKAVESVNSQTYRDFELLVVDNGSTDSSAQLLKEYQQAHPEANMRIVTLEENRGISGGRNAGIEAAQGTYICFLDSDDYWYPEKLECVQAAIAKDNSLDVICHWEDHITDHDSKLVCYRTPGENTYEDLLVNGNCLSTSALTIRREAMLAIGGFDLSLKCGEEDYDCWLRLAKDGRKFHMIQKALGIFLIRGTSVSAKAKIHYGGVIAMVERHFRTYAEETKNPQVLKLWKRVNAKYLCSAGRQIDIGGDRASALEMYRKAIGSDWTYWKTYAGLLLHLLHK